jgi:glycosyltransferase involved in cell wall biosynthesis
MKIIIAVHHFPPTFKGGAEWRAHRTASWLIKQGHTVKVVCVDSIADAQTANLRWIDDEFDSIPVRRLFLNLAKAPDRMRFEYDNPWIKEHLNQYLAEEKPDIFHLISGYLMTAAAIKAAKQQGLPIVMTLTDFWFLCRRHTLYRSSEQVCFQNTALDCVRCTVEEKRRFKLPAQKMPTLTGLLWQATQPLPPVAKQMALVDDRLATLRAALAEVDVAICPSQFLKQTYLDKGFSAKRMQFLRQGLVHIPPQPPQKSPSARLRIGYIGQVAPHKGVHILIDAFLKLGQGAQQAELKLYGDTSQFPKFYQDMQQKLAGAPQLHEQIKFLGAFDNKQISQIYQEIDVLVVPSVWFENSPNVILEAFAHQTPVIASNLGGMAELITDQRTGLLFDPNDAADLARKLQLILDIPPLLGHLQQNILPPTALDAEMAELIQLYQAVLSQPVTENVSPPTQNVFLYNQ